MPATAEVAVPEAAPHSAMPWSVCAACAYREDAVRLWLQWQPLPPLGCRHFSSRRCAELL